MNNIAIMSILSVIFLNMACVKKAAENQVNNTMFGNKEAVYSKNLIDVDKFFFQIANKKLDEETLRYLHHITIEQLDEIAKTREARLKHYKDTDANPINRTSKNIELTKAIFLETINYINNTSKCEDSKRIRLYRGIGGQGFVKYPVSQDTSELKLHLSSMLSQTIYRRSKYGNTILKKALDTSKTKYKDQIFDYVPVNSKEFSVMLDNNDGVGFPNTLDPDILKNNTSSAASATYKYLDIYNTKPEDVNQYRSNNVTLLRGTWGIQQFFGKGVAYKDDVETGEITPLEGDWKTISTAHTLDDRNYNSPLLSTSLSFENAKKFMGTEDGDKLLILSMCPQRIVPVSSSYYWREEYEVYIPLVILPEEIAQVFTVKGGKMFNENNVEVMNDNIIDKGEVELSQCFDYEREFNNNLEKYLNAFTKKKTASLFEDVISKCPPVPRE